MTKKFCQFKVIISCLVSIIGIQNQSLSKKKEIKKKKLIFDIKKKKERPKKVHINLFSKYP